MKLILAGVAAFALAAAAAVTISFLALRQPARGLPAVVDPLEGWILTA